MISDSSPVFKILIVGDQTVGKTTLIKRFVDGKFDEDTRSTIGVDFSLKSVISSDNAYKFVLQIWDVAGEDRFRSILPHYVPGTEGVILAFDSTRPYTLENLENWISVVKSTADRDPPFLLISTKNDLMAYKNSDRLNAFKEKFPDIKLYIPTSSATGQGVEEVFKAIGSLIIKKYGL